MIAGLQKMTLLDFPGKVACTVFLQGCNYRCPFCHNSELFVGEPTPLMTDEEFLAFLDSRRGLLDGVCVSGGEPTLYPQLEQLLTAVKDKGFAVKLDTNGSRPAVLKRLVERALVDYVAMDVKNAPSRYAQTVGLSAVDLESVEESLRFLIGGAVGYELRTTLVEQLHDEAAMVEMGRWLASLVPNASPRELFLQRFVDRDTVAFSGLSAPSEETAAHWAALLTDILGKASLRKQ